MKLQVMTDATHKGLRDYQEDRYFSASMPEGLCFGVFDGHGGNGCATKAAELFTAIFVDALEEGRPVADAFRGTFIKLNAATSGMEEGSTASVVYIPYAADIVHVAVLGDSPVIVKRADASIWIAPDHNVRTNAEEVTAAEARGGIVLGGYLYVRGEHYGDNLGPGLQMGRALGDAFLAKVLSREPQIFSQPLGVGSFVLVCTDGALDPAHKSVSVAADAVVRLIEAGADAQAIVNRAVATPTGDNVTAMLVRIA